MKISDYQREVMRTASAYPTVAMARSVFGLGIAGEAGEVADLIKKEIGHGHPADVEKMKKELGDVLWYVSALASNYGLTLERVAEANIAKLKARYPNGFSTERSMNRSE